MCIRDRPYTDSYLDTVEKVSFPIRDAVERRWYPMFPCVPICPEGGSNVVTAISSNLFRATGEDAEHLFLALRAIKNFFSLHGTGPMWTKFLNYIRQFLCVRIVLENPLKYWGVRDYIEVNRCV